MHKIYLLMFVSLFFLPACSSDDDGGSSDFEAQILGSWILEEIRIEGADCELIYGDDIEPAYTADEEGCTIASPLGNAKRCINLEFRAGGEGTFFWSEFSSTLDAPMTYNIENDAVEYCLSGSCSGLFSFVGDRLESSGDLRLDQDCKAIYVLRRK